MKLNKTPNHWVDSLDGQTSEMDITHYTVPADQNGQRWESPLKVGEEVVLIRIIDDLPIGTILKVDHVYEEQLLYDMELPNGLNKEFTSYVVGRYTVKLDVAVQRGLCS